MRGSGMPSCLRTLQWSPSKRLNISTRPIRVPMRSKVPGWYYRSGRSHSAPSKRTAGLLAQAPRQFALTQVLADQGFDKLRHLKFPQVVDALPDADQLDRDRQRLGDGRDDTSLRGPVQLGQDEAGQAKRRIECRDLAERVLAGVRVEHQQGLV